MEEWLLVYCKPGQDARAEENLASQGFAVYRPTVDVVKNRVGQKRIVKNESLFPRYIFICIDKHQQSISPVRSTLGVSGLVRFGDTYASASEDLIEEIRENASTRSIHNSDATPFVAGQEVYINGGGLNDVKAIFCKPCGNERAMILISILGRRSQVAVHTKYLQGLQ